MQDEIQQILNEKIYLDFYRGSPQYVVYEYHLVLFGLSQVTRCYLSYMENVEFM